MRTTQGNHVSVDDSITRGDQKRDEIMLEAKHELETGIEDE